MSIGNHEHKSAEMVILSAVEGGLYVNYVSTSLNMTGAAYNLMFVIHSWYSFNINRATHKVWYSACGFSFAELPQLKNRPIETGFKSPTLFKLEVTRDEWRLKKVTRDEWRVTCKSDKGRVTNTSDKGRVTCKRDKGQGTSGHGYWILRMEQNHPVLFINCE